MPLFNYNHSYYFGDSIGPDPIRVVLKQMCGGKVPPDFVKGYKCNGLPEKEHEKLVAWLLANAKIYWTIGIALVEVADTLVAEAVSNANIPPAEYWNEETLAEYRAKKASIRKAKQRRKARKELSAKRKTKAR